MDYGNLLSRAWNLCWDNKFLFVLGFFAALGSGGGGGGGGGGGSSNITFDNRGMPPGLEQGLETFWTRFGPLVIGLACLLVLLGILLWLVRLAAQAGLIDSAARLEAGQSVTFGDAVGLGVGHLGRFVGINLLLYAPFILLGLLGAVVALGTVGTAAFDVIQGGSGEELLTGAGIVIACIGVLVCLLIPLWIVVTIIYPFAQRGAVLRDLSVTDSIRHGWQVVQDNVGDVLLLIVLFLVLGFLVGIVTLIVLAPIALVTLVPVVLNVVNNGSIGVWQGVFAVGVFICLGLLGAVIQSVLVTFRSVTVTLAYEEFTGMDKQPEMVESTAPA